ncbi:DUF1064 domain-containing protein [Clostridiaceae bacterium]|nr:DUF1064 domain-containing protein [Clostridiaceae bacterium]
MGVDVKDLPVAYQAQALQKWAEQERRKKRTPLPCPADGAPGGGRKYHNKPTERVTPAGAVLRFDSQKEARRYDELAALERAGTIRELRMQVDFTLQEAYTDGEGRRVRAIRYRADFTYVRVKETIGEYTFRDQLVVEDVKSRATRTKEYIMKRKLMKERFNIDIQEV